MAEPIVQQLQMAEEGFESYDYFLDRTVYVTVPILVVTADNVRHSELLNHMGSKANKFCQMCMTDIQVCLLEIAVLKHYLAIR